MEKEYIIAFSSFYKAAYAQDVLAEAGIKASLARLPNELVKSCGTGIYLITHDIWAVKNVLENRGIDQRGIYEIRGQGREKKSYIKI